MKSKFVGTLKTAGLYTARFLFVTSPLVSLTTAAAIAGFKPAQNLIEGTIESATETIAQSIVDAAAETAEEARLLLRA